MSEAIQTACKCGQPISRWEAMCGACKDKATVDAAKVVTPSVPCVIVGTDTFFHDLEDAIEDCPGEWAHPCDEELLHINPKWLAEDLAERAVENMCEEAFEDAEDHVKGVDQLTTDIAAALERFNAAQTASSWNPRTGEVFQIASAQGPAA